MKLAIMQPYFFPYIGYFQLINAVDKYILYDNVNFIKDGWIHRNKVLLKNVGTISIIIPLKHKSSFEKIRNIEIYESAKCRRKIKKIILINYQKAPMFKEVYLLIEKCLNFNTDKLSILNSYIIVEVCKYLKISTLIECNSEKYQFIEDDLLENRPSSDKCCNSDSIDKKLSRIFEICKYEKASIYYNAIGGTQLYSKDVFVKNRIELKFIKTNPIIYKQFDNEFVSWLSIIDVMMFNSVATIKSMLDEYELV